MNGKHRAGHPHRRELTGQEVSQVTLEARSFRLWCQERDFNPERDRSVQAYESLVGWLYLNVPAYEPRHRA